VIVVGRFAAMALGVLVKRDARARLRLGQHPGDRSAR
jgi:hypothetical protein